MNRWLLLLSLVAAQSVAQQAYRWTDENGQVHYSDRPGPGATEVRLQGAQGFSVPSQPSAPAATAEPEETPADYTAFDIVQPSQQETLWNIGTVLDVQVDVQPGLQAGHRLGVYLDGQFIDLRATSPQFQLTDVFRGQHDLQAVILDPAGEEVVRSLPVTFMVQQTTILNPNNPNRPGAN